MTSFCEEGKNSGPNDDENKQTAENLLLSKIKTEMADKMI